MDILTVIKNVVMWIWSCIRAILSWFVPVLDALEAVGAGAPPWALGLLAFVVAASLAIFILHLGGD